MSEGNRFYNVIEYPFIIVNNGNVIEVSKAFSSMTEISPKELLNRSLEDAFSSVRIGPSIKLEDIHKDKDYFLFTKSLKVKFINIEIVQEDDKQIYVFIERSDSIIDERSSYLIEMLSGNTSAISVYSIQDFTLLMANELFFNYCNEPYNNEKTSIGRSIYEIIPGFKSSYFEKLFTDIAGDGKVRIFKEFAFNNSKGGTMYCDFSLTPVFEREKIKYIICNLCNVTEKVIHGKNTKKKNEELEAVIENISDAIFIYDAEGKLYSLNKAAREYFPSENLKKYGDGYEYTKFFYFDDTQIPPEEMPFARIKQGEVISDYKAKMVQGDITKYISVSGRPVYNPDHSVRLSVIRSRDITEQVEKEQVIKEQHELLLRKEREKLEAVKASLEMKDEFLSMISHELRTPLNVINAAIQVIYKLCFDELTDKLKKYIGMIRQNSNRQLRLVNNLLDITRANAGNININNSNIDIVHLTKLITESCGIYATQKGITLTFKATMEKKLMALDDDKYERILLNLLSNAIKFTDAGKSINVEMTNDENYVYIKVKDEGIGISRENMNLIFERFGQVNSLLSRQAEGAGIGLSLVKKFVEALGGNIWVKSTLGKGSTFTIKLPCKNVDEEFEKNEKVSFMGKDFVEITNIEFSDIYL